MPRDSGFEHAYAVIMAGGSGTRFWPLSRRKRPKQLLRLFGSASLLEQTVARLRPVIPPERTYVFTSRQLWSEVRRCLPGIPASQIVAEPASRNTAPTLGVAAHEIVRRDPEGLMVVLPSDHAITRPAAFRQALRAACRVGAIEGRSVVMGLKPTRPETGFGYVRLGKLEGQVAGEPVYRVEKFKEKPPLAVARRYVASGRYLWNGGMFVWRASTLLRNFQRFQPRMARLMARLAATGGVRASAAFRRLFPRLESVSIDYALMEKVPAVFAVAAELGWSDVGSWAVFHELSPRDRDDNVRPAYSLSLDSRGNVVVSPGKFVVTVGVKDLVIVETADALLVCARHRAQEVAKAVQALKRRGLNDLL